jgi:hypothetical protein
LFAIAWLAIINRAGLRSVHATRAVVESLAAGVTAERSILAVMAGAGFCGVALGVFAPVDLLSSWLTTIALPGWGVPFLVVTIFMLLGQVGFSPTLTFITLAVVIPDPEILGVSPEIYYAAILGVWGLASIGTPFSVPAMLTARLFDDTPAGVTYRWSPLYLIAAPFSVALLLALLTVAL